MKCVYAVCSLCKNSLEHSTTIRKRRKRNESDSSVITKDCNNPHSQNHKIWNLKPYFDDSYLTVSNLTESVRKGKYVPQKCAKCERIICNKKSC